MSIPRVKEEAVRFLKLTASLVLATIPALALAQQAPSTAAPDSLTGRSIAIRTCVQQGVGNSIRLSRGAETTEPRVAPEATATQHVVFWFPKPDDARLRGRAGTLVEINGRVTDVRQGPVNLSVNDGIYTQADPAKKDEPAAGAESTTTFKVGIDRVRLIATFSCVQSGRSPALAGTATSPEQACC